MAKGEPIKHFREIKRLLMAIGSVQFSSVAQSCLTLCDPMHCSMPGLAVQYQLPEFTQTHVHRVTDTIQPYHPLSSPSLISFQFFLSILCFSCSTGPLQIKASVVKGFDKAQPFWLDSQPTDYPWLLYSHSCCALCNA